MDKTTNRISPAPSASVKALLAEHFKAMQVWRSEAVQKTDAPTRLAAYSKAMEYRQQAIDLYAAECEGA